MFPRAVKVRIFWCQTRAAPVALLVSLGVIKIVAVGVRVLGLAFLLSFGVFPVFG